MEPAKMSLEERQAAFELFLKKYLARGFEQVSRTPTTAELHKPARFPQWWFKEQTLFTDIDEDGTIYVRKV